MKIIDRLDEIIYQANKLKDDITDYNEVLKEIEDISDDYNLTVNKRREQIADIVNSLLEQK